MRTREYMAMQAWEQEAWDWRWTTHCVHVVRLKSGQFAILDQKMNVRGLATERDLAARVQAVLAEPQLAKISIKNQISLADLGL